MTKRHPICHHTLAASRGKQAAFRIEVEAILKSGVTKKSLDRLAMAGARIFTDIEPEDMPESRERTAFDGNFTHRIGS